MERNREPRRASTAATNGLSRKRQRSTILRDSPEEEGQMELQEAVRLRDRANRKDRDRERFCTEDNVDDEEEHDVEEDGRVARMTLMASNQNHRRSYATTGKIGRQSPPSLKVTEEMIGVSVPRKARSGSAKRPSHEYCGSGGGGVGEEQNHRQPSYSPASRSGDVNSPSSSNVSVRKKKSVGPRNHPPKIAKSPTSVQDDIEIEIAEVLYELMKQSQGSKKQESAKNSPQEPDSNGSKRRKLEDEDGFTSTHVQCGSNSSVIKLETEQTAKHEDSSAKVEKISESRVQLCDAASDLGASQSAPVSLDSQKDASAAAKSSLCLKLDADLVDSTIEKANSIASEVHNQREEKFEIDLMALPPLEKDGSTDMEFDPKLTRNDAEELEVKNEKKAEKIVKKELVLEGFGEKKLETSDEKGDLENHFRGIGSELQEAKKQPPMVTVPKAQSSSSSFPIVPGWPGSLPPPGFVSPMKRMTSTDGSSASSTAMQHPLFVLSQPRPKRCTTHHYIARDIYSHQQLTKMNQIWPTTASSASPYGAKPSNPNVKPTAENRILGNPLQVSFLGGNLISKGPGATTFPGHVGKENSSEVTNFMDTAQRKQLVLQQAPQPVPAGNLLHGPAFIFPMSQHQSAVAPTSNQSGTPKSATSTKNSLSSCSAAGASASSSTLPAVAAAMSFNYPSLPGNEAQYMAVLQNSGYSFPISTQVGTQSPLMGGTPHAQAMPFFTGPFYSSQMFHPSQIKQQQPYTQPLTQPAHQNASASSGSSSSHKQLQSQQQRGSQINGNNFFTSTNMQLQQSHKQPVPSSHPSAKLEVEISEDTSTVSDSRALHSQKSLYGHNFAVPAQQLNFALMPSTMLSGGNHSEKQQQPQYSKGGVEFIPSQAFALSYPSFNGSSAAKGINFSSAAQNPAIFQSMSDMVRHGYVVPSAAAKVVPSEGKSGGDKNTGHDERTAIQRKSPMSFGQSSLAFSKPTSTDLPAPTIGKTGFDSSVKTLNFILSPASENRPHSVTSNSNTSTAAAAVDSSNSQQQQQQQIQLQKQQQMMQQHLQQQHTMASRSKATTTNTQSSTSVASNFPNNASVFSQTFIQSNTSAQSTQWKNSARTPFSQGTSLSLSAGTTSTLKNFPQQHGRLLQGHTQQISFGETNTKSATSKPQTILVSNPSPSLLAGVPSDSSVSKNVGGSIRTASPGNKASSTSTTLHSQPTQNSTTGPCQKSSPVCGRNVPSIISTCPSQVSELKH